MIPKTIEDISAEDVAAFIRNEVKERANLDYKRDLPADTKDEKREFLLDIVSFANTSGGDIVFGLNDKRDENGKTSGIPEFVGVDVANEDELKKRLQSIIDSGVEPRVPNVEMKFIRYDKSGVFLIRIPRSWAAPHMVTYQVRPSFYARNNVGKYPLGINEIGELFRNEARLTERMRDFKNHRIAQIIANETPVKLVAAPKIVIHALPIQCFIGKTQTIDFKRLSKDYNFLRPIYWDFHNYRINVDGLLSYSKGHDNGHVNSYLQIYRDGKIEFVEAGLLDLLSCSPNRTIRCT